LTITAFSSEVKEHLSLEVAGITDFFCECGAGRLEIEGYDGNTIEISAVISDKWMNEDEIKEEIGKKITLILEKKGDKAVLESSVESRFLNNTLIDLTVKIPWNLKCDIRDGSGEIKISHINNDLYVKDGSGDLYLKNIKGFVKIKDGSGSIFIDYVQNGLNIDDGSGSINVSNMEGDLKIEDGSGSIEISEVKGTVKIEDGSGSIDVKNVSMDVIIDDGSGGIDANHIGGKLIIENEGSGSLNANYIQGGIVK